MQSDLLNLNHSRRAGDQLALLQQNNCGSKAWQFFSIVICSAESSLPSGLLIFAFRYNTSQALYSTRVALFQAAPDRPWFLPISGISENQRQIWF